MSSNLRVKFSADTAALQGAIGKVNSSIKGLGLGIAASVGAYFTVDAAINGFRALGSAIWDSSQKAAGFEALESQFKTLLGTQDKASARMQEIADFAASTPFEIEGLAKTSKLLQTLGGDILATGDGLRLVGDAAAVSGQPLEEVGLQIGRIFNAITSGTSAGEAINRLQELGLITGKTKIEFENLAAAQKKGTVAIYSAEEAMAKLKSIMPQVQGAMAGLAETTQGKLSNLQDNISQLKVAFGTGFNDGLRVALDAVNNNLPLLKDKFTEMGRLVGEGIAEAVDGDTAKLAKIGSFIGEVIGLSIKDALIYSFASLGSLMLEGANYTPFGMIAKKMFGDDLIDGWVKFSKEANADQFEVGLGESIDKIKDKYKDLLGFDSAENKIKTDEYWYQQAKAFKAQGETVTTLAPMAKHGEAAKAMDNERARMANEKARENRMNSVSLIDSGFKPSITKLFSGSLEKALQGAKQSVIPLEQNNLKDYLPALARVGGMKQLTTANPLVSLHKTTNRILTRIEQNTSNPQAATYA